MKANLTLIIGLGLFCLTNIKSYCQTKTDYGTFSPDLYKEEISDEVAKKYSNVSLTKGQLQAIAELVYNRDATIKNITNEQMEERLIAFIKNGGNIEILKIRNEHDLVIAETSLKNLKKSHSTVLKNTVISQDNICSVNGVQYFCNTINMDFTDNNKIISGKIAGDNYVFMPCGNTSVRAKKNTEIVFYPDHLVHWDEVKLSENQGQETQDVIKDLNEQHRAEEDMSKCIAGTVHKITIEGNYKVFMYGCHVAIDVPDGSEIEFYSRCWKCIYFYKYFNYARSIKLGKDTNIPTLGLVKKGTTVYGICTFEDKVQPWQGYLMTQ